MKRMLLIGFYVCVLLGSVYAINLPSSDPNQAYNSAAFVNQADKGAAAKTDCPVACPQKSAIRVTKELIQKIAKRSVDSANASEIEQLLGAACSCVTLNPSSESWTCQWKGDLSSNRLQNTINITFEGGMLAGVNAIAQDGVAYTATPNAKVKVYQPQ